MVLTISCPDLEIDIFTGPDGELRIAADPAATDRALPADVGEKVERRGTRGTLFQHDLHDRGKLTDNEFATEKARLLGSETAVPA